MHSHPHMPDVYLPHPLTVSHERGPNMLIGVDGTAYVDFMGQDGCTFLHCYGNESREAVLEKEILLGALQSNIATTNFLDHKAKGMLAYALYNKTGYDKAFFCCSGSEANDAAMKLATRQFYLTHGRTGYIVSFPGYYGRTVGANSASGFNPKYTEGVGGWTLATCPTTREGAMESIRALSSQGSLAGIITETLPGRDLHSGFLSDEMLEEIFALRDKYGFYIIVDEIKTGGGRMGNFLDSSRWRERPDIVTMSKCLAAGLPFGAVLAGNEVWDGIDYSWHTSTMGGNPALCSYATHLISTATRDALSAVVDRGLHLQAGLNRQGWNWVGRGLHINIFTGKYDAFAIRDMLYERGFLVYAIHHDFIALYPNMYTTKIQLDIFMEALGSYE
jgi:acetylornithine/succinyldiaminopimelate/putrescine aminotransferase